jgi:hypothetical protein
MAKRRSINHPVLGRLDYDPKYDWQTAVVGEGAGAVKLRIQCDGNPSDPAGLPLAVKIATKLHKFRAAAASRAVRDLLKLKNDVWREDGEPKVGAAEFRRRVQLKTVVVSGKDIAEFYHLDDDLFWGHLILVPMRAGGGSRRPT